MKVLIVDDCSDTAEITALLLRLKGFECRSALSAEEAIQIADEWHPQAITVDLGMPKVDGFEFARKIRLLHGAGVNLVAVTGHGMKDTLLECEDAGFDSHVLKPFESSELIQKIGRG